MSVKYTKAPISEIVLGIFFKSNVLNNHGILYEFIFQLTKEFPVINTHPVSPEEEIINNSLQAGLDYSKSGFSTYRLSSSDMRWQVILQQNFITFHWARQDFESVGSYPGFKNVFDKFVIIINKLKDSFSKFQDNFENDIKAYYLTYNDRVNFDEYKKDGLSISDLINSPAPYFNFGDKTFSANNYVCRYSIPCEDIGGHSILTVNTPTFGNTGQLLIVENRLRGLLSEASNFQSWFRIAHEIQVSFFESFFTKKILKNWE